MHGISIIQVGSGPALSVVGYRVSLKPVVFDDQERYFPEDQHF